MREILFKNLRLLDPIEGTVKPGCEVLVWDNLIAAMSGSVKAPEAQIVDIGGRVLMPGLIDCHVHITPFV